MSSAQFMVFWIKASSHFFNLPQKVGGKIDIEAFYNVLKSHIHFNFRGLIDLMKNTINFAPLIT